MRSLYSSPLRVYLLLGILSLVGIFCGTTLPVSLFPNSSKPEIVAFIPYGDMTAKGFLDAYGSNLESSMAALNTNLVTTERIEANYRKGFVVYNIHFPWNTPPNEALKEVENLVTRTTSTMSEVVRRGSYTYSNSEDMGFFSASFFSPTRDLQSLYEILDPIFSPELKKINGASEAILWNPSYREIQIEIIPERLIENQLLPVDITRAVLSAMESYQGGSVQVADKSLQILVNSAVVTIEDLKKVLIVTPQGRTLHLAHIAKIDYTTPLSKSRVIRTSGSVSVMMYATPKADGNIKKMCEDLIALIEAKKHLFPPDVQYKILVDPSEFIRSSINNVLHEVLLAAGLAVVVLFLFIGSLKNVITAAIEIPMSIVLAFILMKMTGMNLNLISLGGLALSAGMNVDGSVVVMENIFRHFEKAKANLNFKEKLDLLMVAVNEVKLPIIASTIASIVVFVPLIFTRGLSSAILGDLAKAVVFSHGLSAIVALILVPTVRLQMMKGESHFHSSSPIEKYLVRLENAYARGLDYFLKRSYSRKLTYGLLVVLLLLLIKFVIPTLPKEIIGTPDTDWVVLVQSTQGNTLVRQMETQSEEVEAKLLQLLDGRSLYTFTQIQNPNRCRIMLRLKNKKDMEKVMKEIETAFPNSPTVSFNVSPYNPSELPLPDPDHLHIIVRAKDAVAMSALSQEVMNSLQEKEIYNSLESVPSTERNEEISFQPRLELWPEILKAGARLSTSDVADYTRVATEGRTIGYMNVKNEQPRIVLKYPQDYVHSAEELSALPLNIAGKLVPLKALGTVSVLPSQPSIWRTDQQEQFLIKGRLKKEEAGQSEVALEKAKAIVNDWRAKKKELPADSSVAFGTPSKEIDEALHQLTWALAISTGLILITMILQLGTVANSLLVFVAIPLGLIGVLISLFVFKSTLSLNSMLGVILLNGIAVANSIILVDFLNRLVDEGLSPHAAALEAARTRLRPILMTSLTTTLGMLPIALGLGEGGRILQPLGIAVSGGLGVSMLLTLFVVPALQVSYLNWKQHRKGTV
jgi:HAE1 family hydrophobic/amphiphilic exporter-1